MGKTEEKRLAYESAKAYAIERAKREEQFLQVWAKETNGGTAFFVLAFNEPLGEGHRKLMCEVTSTGSLTECY